MNRRSEKKAHPKNILIVCMFYDSIISLVFREGTRRTEMHTNNQFIRSDEDVDDAKVITAVALQCDWIGRTRCDVAGEHRDS